MPHAFVVHLDHKPSGLKKVCWSPSEFCNEQNFMYGSFLVLCSIVIGVNSQRGKLWRLSVGLA